MRFAAHIVDVNGHAMEDVAPAWSSSDESVAVVNRGGLVTAMWNGTDLRYPDNDESQDWLDGLTRNEGEGKCDG